MVKECEFFENCIWSLAKNIREEYCKSKPQKCFTYQFNRLMGNLYAENARK